LGSQKSQGERKKKGREDDGPRKKPFEKEALIEKDKALRPEKGGSQKLKKRWFLLGGGEKWESLKGQNSPERKKDRERTKGR